MGGFVYDRLLEDSLDEHASAYVRLADGVAVERDFRWTAFRLRNGARWHDGRPVTREDVLYTLRCWDREGRLPGSECGHRPDQGRRTDV